MKRDVYQRNHFQKKVKLKHSLEARSKIQKKWSTSFDLQSGSAERKWRKREETDVF
jgi:hypothetical protein